MKNLFLFLVILICTGSTLAQKTKEAKDKKQPPAEIQAPTNDTMTQDAFLFANGLCDCMEGMLKKLHPALQQMLIDLVDLGPEEAQVKLEKKLTEANQEDQLKIMQDAESMATIDQQLEDNCGHLESIGSQYDNNSAFLNHILDQLAGMKDCTLTYKTMKLGLAGQK